MAKLMSFILFTLMYLQSAYAQDECALVPEDCRDVLPYDYAQKDFPPLALSFFPRTLLLDTAFTCRMDVGNAACRYLYPPCPNITTDVFVCPEVCSVEDCRFINIVSDFMCQALPADFIYQEIEPGLCTNATLPTASPLDQQKTTIFTSETITMTDFDVFILATAATEIVTDLETDRNTAISTDSITRIDGGTSGATDTVTDLETDRNTVIATGSITRIDGGNAGIMDTLTDLETKRNTVIATDFITRIDDGSSVMITEEDVTVTDKSTLSTLNIGMESEVVTEIRTNTLSQATFPMANLVEQQRNTGLTLETMKMTAITGATEIITNLETGRGTEIATGSLTQVEGGPSSTDDMGTFTDTDIGGTPSRNIPTEVILITELETESVTETVTKLQTKILTTEATDRTTTPALTEILTTEAADRTTTPALTEILTTEAADGTTTPALTEILTTEAADRTTTPALTGPECYTCRGNENCSMPLENLESISCPYRSVCTFINVTAAFTVLGSSSDITRDCFPDTLGGDFCISSAEYIEDILVPRFPEIRDTILSNSGAACFCSEDFCNSEIPEVMVALREEGPHLQADLALEKVIDQTVPEPVQDVTRGCFSNFAATGCISSDEYIKVATADDANITDVIISTKGRACFCNEDLCNTYIEGSGKATTIVFVAKRTFADA
ncbi:hypothetical protein HOLleu_15505 [Holothuria leucospilota]|uniref:Uncharacterized protein n=1 Tax=Holothuria leucospilota TaxID=206669 RepID=A0A9Q1HD81_HOLLE|nr:hypothetical protein HOLleu_15505 [Holothuria leucospilota]